MASGQTPQIISPPPQTIESGDWVTLAFRLEGEFDEAPNAQAIKPKWTLPPGWLVLIPPPELPRQLKGPMLVTITLQVPKSARAGDYDIGLMLGDAHTSARVTVKGHHALALSFRTRTNTNTQIPDWDPDTPLEAWVDVSLTGNQAKAVRLQAKTPDGIEVELVPSVLNLNPGDFFIVMLRLQAIETARWPLGGRMPVRIIALDETSNTPLASASQTWRVQAHHDLGQTALSWPVMGYVQHHARWPMPIQGRSLDWGLSGRWALDGSADATEASSHLRFAWATDRPWQRHLAYRHDGFHVQLGHQVFGERGVARPTQWAKGLSLAWGHHSRMGLDVFESNHDRYHRPWITHGAWRYAWTRRSNASEASRHGWSLAYQPTLNSKSHHWDHLNIQLAGSDAGVAAWADLMYRPSSHQKVRMQFHSVPIGDFSGLRAGQRWRLDAVRSASPVVHSGWMVALFRDADRMMTHHWMGYIHRPLTGSLSARLAAEHASQGHLSGLDLSLRGRLGSVAWRSALNTRGRWQLSLRGQGGRGRGQDPMRWFVHHRSSARGDQVSRAGLEGGHSTGWRWRLGLERSQSLRSSQTSSQVTEIALTEPAGVNDLGIDPLLGLSVATQNALSMSLVKSVGQGGQWAWIIHQSLSEPQAGALMLQYRWHHRFKAPIRANSPLGVINGQVRSLGDAKPIVGAWISLAGQRAQTDDQGRYRFSGIPPGRYWLELEQHRAIEGWLAMDGYGQEVMIASSQVMAVDWALVAKGSIEGRIQWPAQSPIPPPQWRDYHLLGRCDGCPITHRHRMISIDPNGYFEPTALSPGLWRWRLQGPTLPDDYLSNLEEVEVMIQSGHVSSLHWVIDHRPTPVEWISTEAVKVVH